MIIKVLSLLTCSLILLLPSARAASPTLEVNSAASQISFKAVGKPGFMRINGEGKNLTGTVQPELGTAHFELPLDTLVTGIDQRDHHMKEKYLEVQKYPKVELDGSSIKMNLPGSTDSDFKAKLTLHGVSKDIDGHGKLECKSEQTCSFNGSFSFELPDFNIDIPSFAGITVAKKVEIEATIEFIAGH